MSVFAGGKPFDWWWALGAGAVFFRPRRMQKNKMAAMATKATNPPTDPAIIGIFDPIGFGCGTGAPLQVPVGVNGAVFTGTVIWDDLQSRKFPALSIAKPQVRSQIELCSFIAVHCGEFRTVALDEAEDADHRSPTAIMPLSEDPTIARNRMQQPPTSQ
jgi:hypothetical protein